MKVLHVLAELKYSGAEIMYVGAADNFIEKKCDLSVVATCESLGEYGPEFLHVGYKVWHMPCPELRNYLLRVIYYIKFIKFIKKEKYDIIHVHRHSVMWGIAMCAWIANTTCLYTFHNVHPSRYLTYAYHCLLRWSAKFIFNCKYQTISDSVYNHEMNYYHNKTTKIYNWYDDRRFYPATLLEKSTVRNELDIRPDTFVLISIGGCSYIKRHTEVIKALSEVTKVIPNCLYLHLGCGDAVEEEIQLAKDLGLNDKIRFCGNQNDVRKYLIASDVYLMTSLFEGISITTIEAMACKIPAILYDVPGLKDFNNHTENCILVSSNYHVLAKEIIFFEKNSKKFDFVSTNAFEYVNENYSKEKNTNLIYELYKRF